jgi:hypothetical protein
MRPNRARQHNRDEQGQHGKAGGKIERQAEFQYRAMRDTTPRELRVGEGASTIPAEAAAKISP